MEWLLIIHSLTWFSLFPFYHIMGAVQTLPYNPYLCNFEIQAQEARKLTQVKVY